MPRMLSLVFQLKRVWLTNNNELILIQLDLNIERHGILIMNDKVIFDKEGNKH